MLFFCAFLLPNATAWGMSFFATAENLNRTLFVTL